jgi:hypothetical protein
MRVVRSQTFDFCGGEAPATSYTIGIATAPESGAVGFGCGPEGARQFEPGGGYLEWSMRETLLTRR